MGHSSTLKKIDEFCDNFDEEVIQWKTNLESSHKEQRMISEVHKIVSCSAKEIIPYDLPTVNVADLGLSFTFQAGYTAGENLDATNIKERIKVTLMGKFNESVFKSVMDMIQNSDKDIVTLEAIKHVQHELAIFHPPSFQIIGDNLDMFVKTKHITSTHQNSSIHWFNLNAVLCECKSSSK
jgi:hypothetical protein